MVYILQFFFYGIPVAAVLYFAISLYRYLKAKKANKAEPDAVLPEEMKLRKTHLVTSSIIAGVLAALVIGIAILLFTAVAFM